VQVLILMLPIMVVNQRCCRCFCSAVEASSDADTNVWAEIAVDVAAAAALMDFVEDSDHVAAHHA